MTVWHVDNESADMMNDSAKMLTYGNDNFQNIKKTESINQYIEC